VILFLGRRCNANEGIVVFDLENHSIFMTQASNCGSTPAALNKATDLNTITGICGTTASAVSGGSSASAPGFGNAGAGVGAGSGAAGGSQTVTGGASIHRSGFGLIGGFGIMAAMAVGVLS